MEKRTPERGFTLIELLVTMGLMALLATVSIAGYYGAVRGMTDRGVKQDVISFIRLAQQRAMVEQTPVAVFFENRCMRNEDEELGETEHVAGRAVAVRMAGRVSCISKSGLYGVGAVYLIDEYADFDKTYPTNSLPRQPVSKGTMRLYRMRANANSLEQFCTLVEDQIVQARVTLDRDDLLNTNRDPSFGGNYNYDDNDVMKAIASAWAFREAPGNNWLSGSQWCVGDPYGTEIATLSLPNGYVFGSGSPPRIVGEVKGVGKPQFFDPDALDAETVQGSKFDFDTIVLSSIRPGDNTPKKFDSVSKSDLNDDSRN